jgi:hypothetical protein
VAPINNFISLIAIIAGHIDRAEAQEEADLSSQRETNALSKFRDEERRVCLALWDEVAKMLKRAESTK